MKSWDKKSDEWDLREKGWASEVKGSNPMPADKTSEGLKKFNPKTRFGLMLSWMFIFILSSVILWYTMFDPYAINVTLFFMSTALISGVILIMKYGRDILVSFANFLTKNSLA